MTRYLRMWQRSFDRWFLEYRDRGASEDTAIKLAEVKADEELNRYVDDKLEQLKLGE